MQSSQHPLLSRLPLAAAVAATVLAVTPASDARVVRIVIDAKTSPAFSGQEFPAGSGRKYETIVGRAFGELDPRDPLNAIIQDIDLAKDSDGVVRYVASFFLVKPVDMSMSSGLMWHDVPNRGGRITIVSAERDFGDVGLSSAWQGDNSGNTAVPAGATNLTPITFSNEWVMVPIAKNPDGSSVTGRVFGRIVNRSGAASQQIFIQNNPMPYRPATLDTTQATLVTRTRESVDGLVISGETVIPSTDWAWGKCSAFPTAVYDPAQPTHVCVKGGFNPNLLYQVVYTAIDPYALGVGFAAWRDVGSFFKYSSNDDFGNPNPLQTKLPSWSIGRGVSQSGNYLRGSLHLGFNEDEAQRQVHDGLWPIIAGRRIALNFRWAQPDGVLELYQAGSEGPQWWHRFPDTIRGLPPRGILDRCMRSETCPKVMEHFGSAEVWALKLTPEWVGTDPKNDIPIPDNVRRYYLPSTTHGGGAGGFDSSLPGVGLPTTGPNCPGNNFGRGVLPANPVPHTQTVNALRVHFRNWVMSGALPPESRYPTLRGSKSERNLVDADKQAIGFPTLPQLATWPNVPSNFIMPVLDYDFGPDFNYSDGSGVPTVVPPTIKQVIKMLVPRVDADGNEYGGVPLVLRDAPLGTYLGWNITGTDGGARPFHRDQICDYVGSMIPFARTKAERLANGDPRLSLEERYGTHAGYVDAVRKAAANAVAQGFLLQADADALVAQANASQVLK